MDKYKKDIDIPNLIRADDYYNSISFIKNYEDTLQKIFQSSKKSNLTECDDIYLWAINKNTNNDLFDNMITFVPEDYGLELNNYNNIVITGPYIRNCLINAIDTKDNQDKLSIRGDIYIYKCSDDKWSDIVPNISDYEEKDQEYIYEYDDKKITHE